MIEKLTKVQSFIREVKKIWHTSLGLIVVILAITFIYTEATNSFFVSLKDSFSQHGRAINIAQYFIYGLLILLTFIIWCFNRKIPRFSSKDIGILFCPAVNEELTEISRRLKDSLYTELKRFGLEFKIKDLPPNHRITDLFCAHEIRKVSNAYLIIWGPFETGTIREKRAVGFPSISFTFRTPPIKSDILPYFYIDIGLGIVGKNWRIDPANDFFGVDILSKKITEAALNIIGKVLLGYGDYGNAIKVLKYLLATYLTYREIENNPLLKAFVSSVKAAISYAYYAKSRELYEKDIFPNLESDIPEERIKIGLGTVTEAIKFNNRDGGSYLLRAIYRFLSNNIEQAQEDVAKAMQYRLRLDGVAYLSGAFLYFFKGDLAKGIKRYQRATHKNITSQIIKEVIIFINKMIEKYPKKIQFHLALGFINKEWLDLAIAKEELKAFIEKARKQGIYTEFIPFAQKELNRIKN